jgi:ketosteroid isomerase-like protein
MNPEAQLAAFFAAWMRHDADGMAAFYSEDAVMEDPTLAAPRCGREEIHGYYTQMFAELERPEHELVDYAQRDSRLWFQWTFASGGTRMPRRAYRGVSVQTLRDGLIVRDEAFWHPDG